MKLHISDNGDSSVGIGQMHITMDFFDSYFRFVDTDFKTREKFKKDIAEALEKNFDFCGKIHLTFDDECPDCGRKLSGSKILGDCITKGCISNREERQMESEVVE